MYLLRMLDTLLLRLSLHFTCRHFTSSHLNFTQLHLSTLLFCLTLFKFPSAPFHVTLLHFILLHFTALLDDFCQSCAFHFTPFIIAFLILFLKILGLQGKVPNTSTGSWFQFLMVLFTRESPKHFYR
jgi:hypothetical protein